MKGLWSFIFDIVEVKWFWLIVFWISDPKGFANRNTPTRPPIRSEWQGGREINLFIIEDEKQKD